MADSVKPRDWSVDTNQNGGRVCALAAGVRYELCVPSMLSKGVKVMRTPTATIIPRISRGKEASDVYSEDDTVRNIVLND